MDNYQWLFMFVLTIILLFRYNSNKKYYKKQIFHHMIMLRLLTDIFIYLLLNYHILNTEKGLLDMFSVSNFESSLMGKCILSLYGLLIYYILIMPLINTQ
jgi:hypothetical protein